MERQLLVVQINATQINGQKPENEMQILI